MYLQFYSPLLLDSFKGNWDIHFSPGSCISYILFFFFFTMHSRKQFLRKSGSSLISRLSVVSFSPKIKRLNNELTLIQAVLGTIYGHMCRDADFRSTALGLPCFICVASAHQLFGGEHGCSSEPGHCSGVWS